MPSQTHSPIESLPENTGQFRLPDGGDLYYEILGQEGPWVAVISGGRHSLADLKGLARKIAARGYRVVIHDRRNCGRSSLMFDTLEPEDVFWADDLCALLVHLRAQPAFVVGRSRGGRVAIRLVERHPEMVRGLMLWGLCGGAAAVRVLDEYYYSKYIRACLTGGMPAVSALDHFAGLIASRPGNREILLGLDPVRFLTAMNHWRDAFLAGRDRPVMGIRDDTLRAITVPVAIVPYYDWMHPYTTSVFARELIADCRFFDFDPARRENAKMTEADAARDEATVAAILDSLHSASGPPTKARTRT